MKKTLIALAALSCIAYGESFTLPGSSDFNWIKGSNASGIGNQNITAESVKNLAKTILASNLDLDGWFGGTGQGYDNNREIGVNADGSIFVTSRPRYAGEYIAVGLATDGAIESITLTFTSNLNVGYSLWSYDSETSTATELFKYVNTGVSGTVTETYNASEVDASNLFVVWTANPTNGAASGGTKITISGIDVSYTPAVPEPTTATLSLLALAGLAARRRRK